MSETSFPISDLLRRKLQTVLMIFVLALSVASTLFLLSLGDRIGFEILSITEDRLTSAFSSVLSRFIIFVGFLIILVATVAIAFEAFTMMSQRIRDIALMKAAGCPGGLVFGYFVTELLVVTFFGCLLGIVVGIAADFASARLLNLAGFEVSQAPTNLWFALIVFVLFSVLSLVVGSKPILDSARIEPTKAMSPSYYLGLTRESDFRGSAKVGLTFRIAFRSLFRRKSASSRILLCLTTVFILLTVSIAGGLIAYQTTTSWIEGAVGRDVILVAHKDLCAQYYLLLAKFYEPTQDTQFDYTLPEYRIPAALIDRLQMIPNVTLDSRLVIEAQINEVRGWKIDPETDATRSIGDNRSSESLIVGVEPDDVLTSWTVDGGFLEDDSTYEAVIGDTLAQEIFSVPIDQKAKFLGETFDVIGVCLDPMNNGRIVYVPLKTLQNITGTTEINALTIKATTSADRNDLLNLVSATASELATDFEVLEINNALNRQLNFLGHIWSTIMFLPLLALASASVCVVGYVVLVIKEQSREFGILRVVGARPKAVVKIITAQTFMILVSSFAAGIPLGIITTLLILMPDPIVTSYTILVIVGWLLAAFAVTLISIVYPAVKFSREPILNMLDQT